MMIIQNKILKIKKITHIKTILIHKLKLHLQVVDVEN